MGVTPPHHTHTMDPVWHQVEENFRVVACGLLCRHQANWDPETKVFKDKDGVKHEWTTNDDGCGRPIRFPYAASEFDQIISMIAQTAYFRAKEVWD